MTYLFNEAQLELPPALVDKSVQMFVPASGANDFNIVVSRQAPEPGDSLEMFAQRALDEVRKAVTEFELLNRTPKALGGVPALETNYAWRTNDRLLYQRQWAVLAPGAEPDRPSGLMVTATSQGPFSEANALLFAEVLNSLKWRYAPAQASAETADAVTPLSSYCFGQSKRRETVLYVFKTVEPACTSVSFDDAKSGDWKFFGAAGQALAVVSDPNLTSFWFKDAPGGETLASVLANGMNIEHVGNWSDAEREHLARYLQAYRQSAEGAAHA